MKRVVLLLFQASVSAVVLGLGLLILGMPAQAQTLAVGSQGNAWNNVAVLVSGVSNALDTNRCVTGYTSAFGTTGGAATLTVQYSQNTVNWYSSATTTGAVTGNFALTFSHGARYVRLISSAAVTITATLACK